MSQVTERKMGPAAPSSPLSTSYSDQLAVSGLTIDFSDPEGVGRRVVDGVSFTVPRGSFSALIGESGSGKSLTCLATLGLVDRAAKLSGRITFEGVSFDASDSSTPTRLRGSGISMIFQDPVASLNPVRTIGAQLVETIRVHDRAQNRNAARRLALDLLDRVGLTHPEQRMGQYPHELSGGMNQRVMIALAFASRPTMLIADEPTTALDARIQRQVMDLIDDLRRNEGLTVLLVSHDLALVWDYAEFISIMQNGRIVEAGTPQDLSDRSQLHPYAETLFRASGLWS